MTDRFPGDAAGRSQTYGALSAAFRYPGDDCGAFGISGADYNDAFDPAVNERACSLREGAYTGDGQTAVFEELLRFYDFFGVARSDDAEMPDHISVQLEFMHVLTHLECELKGSENALASVQRAQHDFISRHLFRLISEVKTNLTSQKAECRELVEQCHGFISAELSRSKRLRATDSGRH